MAPSRLRPQSSTFCPVPPVVGLNMPTWGLGGGKPGVQHKDSSRAVHAAVVGYSVNLSVAALVSWQGHSANWGFVIAKTVSNCAVFGLMRKILL